MSKKYFSPLFFILFLANITHAQPILQGNIAPNIGDIVYLAAADSNSVQVGNPGANQTWNFSAMSPNGAPTLYEYIAPTNTTYGAFYPTANLAVKWIANGETTYAYERKEANQFLILGTRNASITQVYLDPDAQLKFPTNYNGTYQESYSYTTDSGSGVPFLSTGSHSVKYDAYGTLITPLGTFPNTMRIKATTVQTDSAYFSGIEVINHHDYITYDWLQADQPGGLVSVTYFHTISETRYIGIDTFITETGPTKTVNYISAGSVGIFNAPKPLIGLTAITLGPNPTMDWLTLRFTAEQSTELLVQVLDVHGRVLQTETMNTVEGVNSLPISVADLPPGAYFLTLGDGKSWQSWPWQKM